MSLPCPTLVSAQRCQRFTVLELLVVTAIIAILAALLLPAVSAAKDRAKYARWLGNKRNFQVDTDVIAFYTFDAKGNDASVLQNVATGPEDDGHYRGDRYDGTLENGARMDSGRWSAKKALRLDGVDDYVDLGNWNVEPQGDDGFTVLTWFKADDFDVNDARLISKADGTASDNHWFMLSTKLTSGDMRLRFRLKAGGASTTELLASSGNLEANVWTFAAATYDGSSMRIYKNAEEVGSTAVSGALQTDGDIDVRMGANPTNDKEFDGLIGEMAVLRRGMSANEVRDYFLMSQP